MVARLRYEICKRGLYCSQPDSLAHDHTGNYSTALSKLNTPELQVADNDYAVDLVIEKIAHSKYADSTLIFVIEDDAQNGGDHVDAHRSTAFIVGPYVRQGAVVSTRYNTINFLRTIERVLGLAPVHLTDSVAQPMADVFDVNQSSWTYTATPSAILYNNTLPLPPKAAGLQAGCGVLKPRTNDIDPRFAVTWAPQALAGRTVFRGGFGIYHGDGQLEDQNLPASNDQVHYSLITRETPDLSYPIDPFLASAHGILPPRAQNRNRKDEYSSQWSIAVQQELPLKITGTVSYAGNKGTDLQTITYTNIVDPLTGMRPHPGLGR